MKAPFGYILVFLIPLLSFGQSSEEIKFLWKTAEFNSKKFKKAIMLIPVKFESDTTTYFLQFDTGATHSCLYSNRVNWFKSGEQVMKTSIGEVTFRDNKSIKATAEKNASIGTLGADFLKNKLVQINFPGQTIRINASYNATDYFMKPLNTLNGRPVISVKIFGKEQDLLYDTGSSLFGIWTNEKNWKRLKERSDNVSSFPISSWGKINTGYYSGIDKSLPAIIDGSNDKQDLQVWYVDNKKYKKFFRRNNLYGILGNQPFLNKEIILDYNKKVFGVKN